MFSCISNEQELTDDYNKQSNLLLAEILTKDFNCNCVIEPIQTALEYKEAMRSGDDNKKTFVQQINLRDEIELDSLNALSKSLKLNQTIKNSKYKFVSYKKWHSILSITDKVKKYQTIDSICPKGYVIISKPILNKSLDNSIIEIDYMPSCFVGWSYVFDHNGEKWIVPDEHFN